MQSREGYPPGISYEYQKKRVRKFAFRKGLILKEMGLKDQNCPTKGKKKSGTEVPHSQTQISISLSVSEIRKMSRAIFGFAK